MPFPLDDEFWIEIRDFLKRHAQPTAAILAPNEFMEFFSGNYHYRITYVLSPQRFDFVVFHKGMVHEVEPPFIVAVLEQFQPVFANPVFVVYAKQPLEAAPPVVDRHIQPLLDQLAAVETIQRMQTKTPRFASVITTYNRPGSLARSLPQILALGAPVVVVDDASAAEHDLENRRITDAHQVPLIRLPENRGLPNAINIGIGYWLADPDVDWISYFQDDVDVHPDLFTILATIQDAQECPLLAGKDASEHPTFATGAVGGYQVLYKRSLPGQHLHAHRDYWAGVLPIPTPYLGAPKPVGRKHGQGADEDWWITAWSPNSITKQGGYLIVVPGLVRTFQAGAAGSTWDNASARDTTGAALLEAPLPDLTVPTAEAPGTPPQWIEERKRNEGDVPVHLLGRGAAVGVGEA